MRIEQGVRFMLRSHGSNWTTLLLLFLVGAVANGACQTPAARSAGSALRQVANVDLPGPAGKRFDYLTTDDDDHYLLSAHLGAGLLYVIDMKTNRLVKAIPDVPGVEGVEFVPELKKVYTSNWHENKIGVIDLRQMKVIKKIPTEDKPDGAARFSASTWHPADGCRPLVPAAAVKNRPAPLDTPSFHRE